MIHVKVDVNMPVRDVVLLQGIYGDFGVVLLGY
jgi:hypothetical protein